MLKRVSWVLCGILIMGMVSCGKDKPDTSDLPYQAGVYKSDTTVMFVYVPEETLDSVAITGDFNAWDETGIPLEYENGIWKVIVKLDYGIYQYKYILNGTEKVSDPAGEASMPDGKGGKNSIIEVTVN